MQHTHAARVFIFKTPSNPSQQQAHSAALAKLKSYTETHEPKLARWLYDTWNAQQEAIKYQELKKAILQGDITLEYIKQWQQDYAILVNTKLAPAWLDAMEAASDQLKAKYPEWVFDPTWPAVQKWVQDHGTQLAVNLTQTQHEALKQIVNKAAFMGELGPDELSRCIRPLIGMVPREAAAVLSYYEALRKDGMGIKQAQNQAANYAGRVHRHRAMRIARTELSFAYNQGIDSGVKQAQLEGLIGQVQKRWLTADDERVCPICGPLDGQPVAQDEEFGIPTPEKFTGMHRLPPAHPHCRCTVIYEEVQPVGQKPGAKLVSEADLETMNQEARPVHVPPKPTVPDANSLTWVDDGASLGGAGKKAIYEDKHGNGWLFKPAITKGGADAEYKAYAQEASCRVQKIVDEETAVQTGVVKIKGKIGALQEMVQSFEPLDLKEWQETTDKLPAGTLKNLQREHVTDWLLGNFDAHGGNFVINEDGRVCGVDKEQAFRYLNDPNSWKMSYTFHPNGKYGETEPIYNTIFRRYAKKEIDLDLQEALPYIKRVEAIPNSEYREMFREYAESLYGKGKTAEDCLDRIVIRKTNLRETYRDFYGQLIKERTGKAHKFIFADEGAEAVNQPLTAQLLGHDALHKLTTPELMQMAKANKIAYYNNMNKKELVTSLAEPDKAPLMSAQVRDRLKAAELARQGRAMEQTAQATQVATAELDQLEADFLFRDLSIIPKDRLHGVGVKSDTINVEGMNFTARKINISGDDYYEISGKLTQGKWSYARSHMPAGSLQSNFGFEEGRIDYQKGELQYTRSLIDTRIGMDAIGFKYKHTSVELFNNDTTRGMMGTFRIRVKDIGGPEAAKEVQEALKKAGLEELCSAPPQEAKDLLKKIRLLWQNAPEDAATIQNRSIADMTKYVDKLLQKNGISATRMKRLVEREVFPGYKTYVEDGVAAEYKKAGAEYLFHGVPRVENMVQVLKSPGLFATNERYRMGIGVNGASSSSDMRTGGSDSIFLRLVTKNAKQSGRYEFENAYYGHGYRVIIDPKVMERTDWYGYESDSYGTTEGSTFRQRSNPLDLIKGLSKHYEVGNELMFRKGIPKEAFTGITCDTNSMKADLSVRLKQEGITEINGIDVWDFIKVRREL